MQKRRVRPISANIRIKRKIETTRDQGHATDQQNDTRFSSELYKSIDAYSKRYTLSRPNNSNRVQSDESINITTAKSKEYEPY